MRHRNRYESGGFDPCLPKYWAQLQDGNTSLPELVGGQNRLQKAGVLSVTFILLRNARRATAVAELLPKQQR